MGKMQRVKGATYEREIAKFFSELLGAEFKRVLGQERDGGGDVTAENCGLLIECKRYKAMMMLYSWMRQAVVSAFSSLVPKIPVLAIRTDNEETLIVIRMKDVLAFAQEVLPDA